MNHRVNAKVHRLPQCPECGAAAEMPCVSARGLFVEREPHDIRLRVKSGEVVVLEVETVRAARKVRALKELVAAVSKAG